MRSWLALCLLVSACDESSQGFPNGCSGDYDQLMGGLCDFLSRCPDVYPLGTSTREQCKSTLCWASTCRLSAQRSGNQNVFTLKQTTPTVSAAATKACLDWLSTVSCADGNFLSGGVASPCSNVISTSDDSNSTDD